MSGFVVLGISSETFGSGERRTSVMKMNDSPVTIAGGGLSGLAAALAVGLLRRDDPGVVLERAVEVATFVCTRPGATPVLPEHLREPFSE